MTAELAERTEQGELVLDPFVFVAGAASGIKGLGGSDRPPTMDYAFHTAYVEAATGRVAFRLQFDGLKATKGTLVLRVHMVPLDAGGPVSMVNSQRIALNRLAHRGGDAEITFEGFRDVTYALVGVIAGDTDAEAAGLTVILDRPADPAEAEQLGPESKSTSFGKIPLAPAPFLLSSAKPTLKDPVSQLATASQLREPVAESWMARLRPRGRTGVEHWRKIYTLQVLHRYGMLEKGAKGLGFERSPSGLPAALAAMNIGVVATFPVRPGPAPKAEALLDDLRDRAPCDEAAFAENVAVRLASWRRIPEDLVNFDFLWSARANESLYSVAATVQFVEEAMRCLRPGGLAVHVMSYDLAPGGRSTPSGERILLQQNDVERLSLVLVSRGYEVAQFKIDSSDVIVSDVANHGVSQRTMVGVIARKPRLPD